MPTALRRQQHRRADLQARPGQRQRTIPLDQGQQAAAAQPGGLLGNHQIHQRGAGCLGLGGRQSLRRLQRLPGLGLGLQLQEPGQAAEVFLH